MSTGTTADSPSVVQLLSFAHRHAQSNPDYLHPLERRNETRAQLIVPAVVQAVTADLECLDEPIDVVTRDISESGIGLISDVGLDHELYTVKFSVHGKSTYLLARKVWSAARGPFDFVGMDALREL